MRCCKILICTPFSVLSLSYHCLFHLRCFDAFYSKTAEEKSDVEPSYQYSRDFGAAFSGAGIGLLKSKVGHLRITSITCCQLSVYNCLQSNLICMSCKVYADFHNGKIALVSSQINKGTVISLEL